MLIKLIKKKEEIGEINYHKLHLNFLQSLGQNRKVINYLIQDVKNLIYQACCVSLNDYQTFKNFIALQNLIFFNYGLQVLN